MPKPARARSAGPPRAARHPRGSGRAIASAALLLALLASTAFAAHLALTLGSSSNAALGERVVVNAQGRTLYALRPETSRHLLCKTSECLRIWPPVAVSSSKTRLKDGPGTHGQLGILRRANGTLQVTLRGLPLYRYSKDHAKGDGNGEGIESFGGTWHAMTATSGESPHKPAMTSPPQVAPAPPSYPSSTPAAPSTTPSAPSTPSSTPSPTPTTPTPPPYPYPAY